MSIIYDGAELEVNASTLYYIYKSEHQLRFDLAKPQKFSAKNAKLLRELIDEQGEDNAVAIIQFAMENWVGVKKVGKISSLPTPNIIFGYRSTILDLMNKPKVNSVEYGKGGYGKNKRSNKNKLFIDK